MSAKKIAIQTIALPKGSIVLGTQNSYHDDGSVNVDVHYSVPKDYAEQMPEPPISAIVIRDGKPRHNREEAPLKWLDTDEEIVQAIIDDDFAHPQQFYRVLPVYFTLDEWRHMHLRIADDDDIPAGLGKRLHEICKFIFDAEK